MSNMKCAIYRFPCAYHPWIYGMAIAIIWENIDDVTTSRRCLYKLAFLTFQTSVQTNRCQRPDGTFTSCLGSCITKSPPLFYRTTFRCQADKLIVIEYIDGLAQDGADSTQPSTHAFCQMDCWLCEIKIYYCSCVAKLHTITAGKSIGKSLF